MKYTIHGGHGYPGKGSTGVVGYINESIQDRIVKDKVKLLLELDGNAVTDITVDEGSQKEILAKLVSRANAVDADANISLHFNASNGQGNGTEVLIKDKDNRTVDMASRVVDRIVDLGFRNRGVKRSSNLYILNKMKNPTILIECCFADNLGDYNKYNDDEMARAIAEGIVGHPIKAPEPKKHTADLVDISCDASMMPVFRLYNPNDGKHFYTAFIVESDVLIDSGWSFEGIAWYSVSSSDYPVFRLYNPNDGKHFYTFSEPEASVLTNSGWSFEGISWYSDPQERVPVYRLYNHNDGNHHFTTSELEKKSLEEAGWYYEGIGWYGCNK